MSDEDKDIDQEGLSLEDEAEPATEEALCRRRGRGAGHAGPATAGTEATVAGTSLPRDGAGDRRDRRRSGG